MFRNLIVGCLLATPVVAQDPACPHRVIDKQEARIEPVAEVPCGSGIKLTRNGVEITASKAVCPLLLLYYPEYNSWQIRAGSERETYVVEQRPVMEYKFACISHWLLGIIPIQVSSACVERSAAVLYSVDHHLDRPCDFDPS